MTRKTIYSVHKVFEKIKNFRHMNLVIHSVIEMSTKISKRFANVNSRNNFVVNYEIWKVLR